MSSGITLGFAHYDDFHGAYFTVHSALVHHPGVVSEVIVIDNNPTSMHGKMLKDFCASLGGKGVKYFPMVGIKGTAATRNMVFEMASNDVVICCDPHVLFPVGSLKSVADYFKTNPKSKDLVQGPLLYDNQVQVSTHFNLDRWGGEMWGQWDIDQKSFDKGKPFEIPAQGLGAFASRKSTWLKFSDKFRGFGGEEGYIHEKYRKAGQKTLCIPQFLWVHRFGRPDGVPYPLSRFDKVRNYCVGFSELGMDLSPIYNHFVKGEGADGGRGLISEEQWVHFVKGEYPPEQQAPVAEGCAPCKAKAQPQISIQEWYNKSVKETSDINEHVPTLKELATGCDVVVEFGVRTGVSTAGLLAGKPNKLLSFDINDSPQARAMAEQAKTEGQSMQFIQGSSLAVDIPECDLLFIDTVHTATQVYSELTKHASKVKKYLVFHDTEAPWGENGEDGGPGVMPAVRRFLSENMKDWALKKHYSNNHGLTVLSRDPEDRKSLPGKIKQAVNFAKAQIKHQLNGGTYLPLELAKERLDDCLVCEYRVGERCSKCSCYLKQVGDDSPIKVGQAGKVFYPTESCPIGKWHPRLNDGVMMDEGQIKIALETI